MMVPNQSLLHLLTPDDQRQALYRIRDHLVDDGHLALNVFDTGLEWIIEDHKFPEVPLRNHAEFIRLDTGNHVVVGATLEYQPME